ncbi:MAG: hypothetical protein HW387_1555 [Parachlamydiales bacterium]|nr:hypothetical protein [Parachlamydiales bacterium]
MAIDVNSMTYNVVLDPETRKFGLDGTKDPSGMQRGLYAYQWTVVKPDGGKRSLAGISEDLRKRLSSYICYFNNPNPEKSSELHCLVRCPANQTSVMVFGPYPETQDAKQLECSYIARIPENEKLNKTTGGNGGGAWSQYDDLPPSEGTFAAQETPIKYYPFRDFGTHISPEFTPSIKNKSGVYVIKKIRHIKRHRSRYIGQSGSVLSRVRKHASDATHSLCSKVSRAIAEEPENWGYGVLPSTIDATPRTRRKAEEYNIDRQHPSLNTNRGGGGPTKFRRIESVGRRLDFLF